MLSEGVVDDDGKALDDVLGVALASADVVGEGVTSGATHNGGSSLLGVLDDDVSCGVVAALACGTLANKETAIASVDRPDTAAFRIDNIRLPTSHLRRSR